MQAKFVQTGKSIDHTPENAVAAGQVVVQGPLVGVAERPISAAVLGALTVRGVFDVVQAAVPFTVGASVYWDDDGNPVGGVLGSGAATSVPTGNTFMGFALAETADTDATVRVVLLSMDSAIAEKFSLADLSDVGALLYTAGRILVADGDSYEDQAISGHASLAGDGTFTLTPHNVTPLAAAPDVADLVLTTDESAQNDPARVVTVAELLTAAGDLTALAAAPAIDDRMLATDESAAGDPAKAITVQELFDAMDGLADATPVVTAAGTDKIPLVDATDNAAKTVTLFELLTTAISTDLAQDGTTGKIGLAAASVTTAKLANAVADQLVNLTVTAGAEVAHARTITVQAKDAQGNDLAARVLVDLLVNATSQDTAPTPTETDTFGNPSAGIIVQTVTGKAHYRVQTDSAGKYVFALTHNDAGSSRFIQAACQGLVATSGEITFDAV